MVPSGDPLPGLLTVASHDGRGDGAIAGPLHGSTAGNTNPVLEGSTLTPLRTGPPSDAITSGVRGSTEGFGRTVSEQSRCVPTMELLGPAVTPYFTV